MVPAAQGSVVIAWWLGQGGAFASVEEKDWGGGLEDVKGPRTQSHNGSYW